MLRAKPMSAALPGSLVIVLLVAASAVLASVPGASASTSARQKVRSYNGLALTPPMGYNDWYENHCNVSQGAILGAARELVSSGLAKLGYDYVDLDDCWMTGKRARNGELQPTSRFPKGIKWLAEHIHGLGLKFGLYESAGTSTCKGQPGSYGHYAEDAKQFASWGVDFVKLDYCGDVPHPEADFSSMSRDLAATGRRIVYSQELPVHAAVRPSKPPFLSYISFSQTISNMWRIAPDEAPSFESTVVGNFEKDLPLAGYVHPGAWNDLDLLLTGNSTFEQWPFAEQEAQMSIWAELASPLVVSTNLADMTSATKRILSNKAVIAVDQDKLGKQGTLVAQGGANKQVYIVAKPLTNGDVAVLFFNTASTGRVRTSVAASALNITASSSYSALNLWTGNTTQMTGAITAGVNPDSVVMYVVSPGTGT